jgi:sterol desaturase/sphingolipid hydroxylase (fatty acid hydroxylase superfamily)
MSYQVVILIVFTLFALKEALYSGIFKKVSEERADRIVELGSTILLFAVSQPLVLFTAAFIMQVVFPEYEGALAHTSIGLQILMLLIFDDLIQYWWHRCCHSVSCLYNLHRAHHRYYRCSL